MEKEILKFDQSVCVCVSVGLHAMSFVLENDHYRNKIISKIF